MTQGLFWQHEGGALSDGANAHRGAATLVRVDGFNNSDGPAYVQLHDSVDRPSEGATPRYTMRVEAGDPFTWTPLPPEAVFRLGVWVMQSTTPDALAPGGSMDLWIDAVGFTRGPAHAPAPAMQYHRYFGPSNAAGAVSSWPDTGSPPLVSALAAGGQEPTAQIGLNGLISVVTEGGTQCAAAIDSGGAPFSLACVARSIDAAGGNSIGFWNLEGDGSRVALYYAGQGVTFSFTGGAEVSEEWAIVFYNDDAGTSLAVSLAPDSVDVLSMVMAYDPTTGAYAIDYQADWAPVASLSGTAALELPALTQLQIFEDGNPELESNETRVWTNRFLASSARAGVLAQFDATWRPLSAVVRLLSINNNEMSESGNADDGWLYSWVSGTLGGSYSGNSDHHLPANTDGSITMTIVSGTANAQGGPALLLLPSAALVNYTGSTVAVFYWDTGNLSQYSVWRNGVQVAKDNNVAAAPGDIVKVTRTGTTMVVEISKDGGGSWLNVVTWLDSYMGALWFGCNTNGPSSMGDFVGVGVQP